MMKILEVRDGFIKFEADKSIFLSSFVRIDGIEKNYVAQVVQLKKSGEFAIAYAKILFLASNDELQPYDKTLPSEDSNITEVTSEILGNSISTELPIIVGKVQSGLNIIADASAFDKKMIASIDDKNESNVVIRNFVKQFNNIGKDVVIIDTLGIVDAKKSVAGVDFKLPLDTESLSFMYQDCLSDATPDSKSLIVEIFKDLADYSKTVPFLPFGTLKMIVDDMVDNSHIFKLLVLKNKLAKFDKLGYFAKDKNEVDKLDGLLNSKCSVIDISKLDNLFQNRYLAFLYEKLQKKENTQVFLILSNVINKKNLKNILKKDNNVSTTIFTHSRFKYLNDIKNLFDNFIIAPSFTNNEIFKVYSTFLNAMPKFSYLVAGEAVNYIPLISNLQIIDEVANASKTQIETISEEVSKVSDEDLEEIADEELDEAVINENEDNDVEKDDEIIEEIIDEPAITKEEILANIEEKSNAAISDAIKDIAPLSTADLFDSEDSAIETDVEEVEDESEFIDDSSELIDLTNEVAEETAEDDNDEASVEPIAEVENLIEQTEPQQTDETSEIIDFPENEEEFAAADSIEDESVEADNNLVTEAVDIESLEEDLESKEESAENAEDTATSEVENFDMEEIVETENYDSEEENFTGIEENDDFSELTTEEYQENDLNSEIEEENEIEISDDLDLDIDSSEELEESPVVENNNLELQDFNPEEIQFRPIAEDFSEFEEITELNPDDTDENDIIVNIEDDDDNDSMPIDDEEIVKEVDKVFTTRKDDDISDSDLDFIDELNNDNEELQEEILEELSAEDNDGILEEPQEPIDLDEADNNNDILETRNSSTPIVPVYDADIPQEDIVTSDPIEQGDSVVHAKYGSGVVEKMIKYGNKTLFSINFDNIGRRLLDPTLTEIKKA